jgi:HPt (histidine-containing phosphotransfer) domain-containing protein
MSTIPPRSEAKSPDGKPSRAVDIEAFRADLREGGVEEMLGVLLTTFMEDAPVRLAALEQALKGENPKDIASAAHAFKSGAGTIRASGLENALRTLEEAGRTNRLESLVPLVEQIRAEYERVLGQLQENASR